MFNGNLKRRIAELEAQNKALQESLSRCRHRNHEGVLLIQKVCGCRIPTKALRDQLSKYIDGPYGL